MHKNKKQLGRLLGEGSPTHLAQCIERGEPNMHFSKHSNTEIEANVRSIQAVPKRLLPIGPAREALLAKARAGEDVEAYTPFQTVPDSQKRWNLWMDGKRTDVEDYVKQFNPSK